MVTHSTNEIFGRISPQSQRIVDTFGRHKYNSQLAQYQPEEQGLLSNAAKKEIQMIKDNNVSLTNLLAQQR